MTALEGARLLRAKAMQKKAYVPLTPAAQQAADMQPQGDPMMAGGGMPPMDPSGMGGMPPADPGMAAQSGMPQMQPGAAAPAPIQMIPGPPDPATGQPMPIDAETGLVVLDPTQGIEMDPVSGIIFMKFTGEFFTPEGQPLDPTQAQQMIIMGQQSVDPSAVQGAAPTDGAAVPPGGMDAQAVSAVDPNGMPAGTVPNAPGMEQAIDPTTGMPLEPQMPAEAAASIDPESAGLPMFSADPGMQDVLQFLMQTQQEQAQVQQEQAVNIDAANKLADETNRTVHKLLDSTTALRRELVQYHDNNDRLAAEMENLVDALQAGLKASERPLGR